MDYLENNAINSLCNVRYLTITIMSQKQITYNLKMKYSYPQIAHHDYRIVIKNDREWKVLV